MKTGVKIALAFVLGFLSGGASGYFFCKSREMKFEICTDEEQLAAAEEDEQKKKPEKKDIREEIEETFKAKEAEKDVKEPKAVQVINTQKTQYWKKFQDEGGKYDRHSEIEEGEDPVTSEEDFDQGFINEIEGSEEETEVTEALPDIEESSLQEFYHWNSIPDGEYDTVSVCWYAGDNALTDEDNQEIKNPVSYLGFNPKDYFDGRRAPDGDPDAIYMKNNKFKTIYEVIRYNSTLSVIQRMGEFGGEE